MHAKPEAILAEHRVADVEHDPPGRKDAPKQAIEAASDRKNTLGKTKRAENGKAGRLQDQAGAKRPRLVELVEERDPVSIARQEKRGRKPGRPGAGNPDRKPRHFP